MLQYDKNSAYTVLFNVSEAKEWFSKYKNIWNEIESQLFEKLTTWPIKGEDRYVHGKLKMWKERIKTNFHGHTICIAMQWQCYRSILSTNKAKVIIPRYMLKSANTPIQKTENVTCWAMTMRIFWSIKRMQKEFCNLPEGYKIINEQDVVTRKSKRVEYILSKLYENKRRTWKSHQRHHHKVQGDYCWCR